MKDVLIVDDEKEIADSIKEYFENFDLTADCAYDDTFLMKDERYSILLLDINLGQKSGYEIVRQVRIQNPEQYIIIISARNTDNDLIRGYGVGADDYIVKPFALSVLLMKVKNILKKVNINHKKKYREYEVDEAAMCLRSAERVVELKNQEFKLFMYLYKNRGKIMDKADIIKNVWGEGYYTDNNLNVHIKRLRDKLGDEDGTMIKTCWGTGYSLI